MGFADDVKKAIDKKMRPALDQKAIVFSLFSGVIANSPRDKGTFVANWYLTTASPSVRMAPGKSATKRGALRFLEGQANAKINYSSNVKMYLTNNMPYAQKIEYGGYGNGTKTVGGYSKQAPQGVVRKTRLDVLRGIKSL